MASPASSGRAWDTAGASDHNICEGHAVGALIMLGTLSGLIVLIFFLVLRYDPQARSPSKREGSRDA